jgi:predicted membrane protein
MKKVFWGLFFLVAGAFIIINQLGYTDINLFSLLCTIFLVSILIKSIYRLSFPGILFPIAFMIIIYQEPLHLENITPWPVLFTALLGSIGLSIIFNKGCWHHKEYHFQKHHCDHYDKVINDVDKENIDFEVSFGSSIKYINSDDFKSANLKASFGAMKAYFDNAKMKGDNATINLDVSFSGVELYIPKEWKVIDKINTTLGGVEFKNHNQDVTKKTVTLTGKVTLSGVEIFYI